MGGPGFTPGQPSGPQFGGGSANGAVPMLSGDLFKQPWLPDQDGGLGFGGVHALGGGQAPGGAAMSSRLHADQVPTLSSPTTTTTRTIATTSKNDNNCSSALGVALLLVLPGARLGFV
jgi:hypothetical protein